MTRIAVAGAGSIGCFVGGCLMAAGHDVALLGRDRVLDPLRGGLRLSDFAGLDLTVTPGLAGSDPAILSGADIVLVCVKSGATADMAQPIAAHAPADAVVVSLQNGVRNADVLRAALPGRDVRAGMVPFNVVPRGPAHLHRATSGDIAIAAGPGALGARLSVPALPVTECDDIDAALWGKLFMNLTNAVNALSGLPVRAMLMDRDWRRLLADQMDEALSVLRVAGLTLHSPAPVPLRFVPAILRLPTPLYARVAARMLTIDPSARTSMAHDLDMGRRTEIDHLQGEVLRLARAQGRDLPVTRAITRAIARAEAGEALPPQSPRDIRAG